MLASYMFTESLCFSVAVVTTVPNPGTHLHDPADLLPSQNWPFLVGRCMGSCIVSLQPYFTDWTMDVLALK